MKAKKKHTAQHTHAHLLTHNDEMIHIHTWIFDTTWGYIRNRAHCTNRSSSWTNKQKQILGTFHLVWWRRRQRHRQRSLFCCCCCCNKLCPLSCLFITEIVNLSMTIGNIITGKPNTATAKKRESSKILQLFGNKRFEPCLCTCFAKKRVLSTLGILFCRNFSADFVVFFVVVAVAVVERVLAFFSLSISK